jgi:processive 1,2-diacylglycerol beta-glucosyltransferase
MKICFSFEELFPAHTRAGRHIETLVRSFRDRGHDVSIITTQSEDALEEEGVVALRLREAPGARGQARRDSLITKAIGKFLKEEDVQVLFAEGLTPLSAVSLKAARKGGIQAILRVLADAGGISASFGSDRKLTPSALKKRVATMLGYADIAAASSRHCAELVSELYDGPVRVIPKCVDLSIFNRDRINDDDIADLRDRCKIGAGPALLYAREELRGETVLAAMPLLAQLREKHPETTLVVAGRIDDAEALEDELAERGMEDAVRLLGSLSQRDLSAAYGLARLYVAPADSRASESELLEAMAMGCPVAVTAGRAETLPDLVESGALLVLGDDLDGESAEQLLAVLEDEDKLGELSASALAGARALDIGIAVDRVEDLCSEVLGVDTAVDQDDEAEDESASDDADAVIFDDASDGSDEADEDEDEAEVPEAPADESGDGEDLRAELDDEDEEARPTRRRRRRRRSEEDGDEAGDAEAEEGAEARDESGDEGERESGSEGDEDEEGRGRRRRRRRRRRGRDEEGSGPEDASVAPAAEDEDSSDEDSQDEKPAKSAKEREDEAVEEASRRLRDLDPRLTLRELMPFLRPPKDVFVFSMSARDGRQRAGEAIFEAFKDVDQNLRVRQFDLREYAPRGTSPEELVARLNEIEHDEASFDLREATAALAARHEEGGDAEDAKAAAPEEAKSEEEIEFSLLDGRLRTMLLEKRPHQVVLTHYLPVAAIASLKREEELNLRITAVVSHQDLMSHWIADGVDQYLVANEKVRFKLIRAGVPASAIEVVGVPVLPSFENSEAKGSGGGGRNRGGQGRGGNGGNSNPTLLYRSAGSDAETARATVERMTRLGANFKLVVLTGGDEDLAKELRRSKTPRGVTLDAHARVEDMGELLAAADLLITRPSSHTAAEALARGIPLLLIEPATGLESRSAEWFVEQGVGLLARDELDLEWLLEDLLRQQAQRLRRMNERAQDRARNRGAARQAVERICKVLH